MFVKKNPYKALIFHLTKRLSNCIKIKMIAIIFLLIQVQQIQQSGAKYYVYLEEVGELQIKVSIWGEVASPGLYSIPDGTDLLTLLSLSGGPQKNANLSRIELIRSFPQSDKITVNLSDFFKTGNRDNISIMKPGDMVFIKPTFLSKAKNFTRYVTEATLVAIVYLQLYNMFNK